MESFITYMSVHDGFVVRIFVGLLWELYCQWKLKQVLKQWRPMGREKRS